MWNTPKPSDNDLIHPRCIDAGEEAVQYGGFPHHAHYIMYCPRSSKSMIILFALVLWEPYKLSYQHHLIITDSDCDVTQTPILWIIHVHLSVLSIEAFAPLQLNIHTSCPTKVCVKFYWSHCVALIAAVCRKRMHCSRLVSEWKRNGMKKLLVSSKLDAQVILVLHRCVISIKELQWHTHTPLAAYNCSTYTLHGP